MRSGRFSLPLLYVDATLVLFCLRESCCYVAILSMRAPRPRFHATSGFFLNRRILRRDLSTKKNQSKKRKITGKPQSHIRILIYQRWAINSVFLFPENSGTLYFNTVKREYSLKNVGVLSLFFFRTGNCSI